MDDQPENTPAGWLEALERADAEIDAGLFVTSEEVHRQLREGTKKLRAKAGLPLPLPTVQNL
jgi:predicted transcriptional regulator